MSQQDLFANDRNQMVFEQIECRGICDSRVLDAMRTVPRHAFVPGSHLDEAYHDHPLPIGCGQTISQPFIVALMTSLLKLQGEENVLEVGTGSGYQAAVLSLLARSVHTIERHLRLVEMAAKTLSDQGYTNVYVHHGDGSAGWPDAAPYQGILVTAAAPTPPQPLIDQLAEGGRLVVPVGSRGGQDLQIWKRGPVGLSCEFSIPVTFVPLRGEYGWSEDDWEGQIY